MHAPAPFHRLLGALGVAWCTTACTSVDAVVQLGYISSRIDGDLSLTASNGSTTGATLQQDVESALGLGDAVGSPYLRARARLGDVVLIGSLFELEESGTGTLNGSFGGLPAAAQVATSLDLTAGKLGAGYQFDLGPIAISPGLLVDVLAIDFVARDVVFENREEIDEVVFVPMPFLRAAAELGQLVGAVEAAYLQIPNLNGQRARFLDVEAAIEWHLFHGANLLAGYRLLSIDAKGDSNADTFAADLRIRGWFIGGGVRF